jgi:3-phenylpropionate/trans-cinnamate dioxygenase beta subunit
MARPAGRDIEYTLDTNTLAQFRDRRKGWAPPSTYIFHEDKYQLERRVARIETGQAWADEPASRTRHFVTNVRILAQAENERGEAELVGLQLPCAPGVEVATTTAISARAATRCAGCTGGGHLPIARRRLELDEFTLMSANVSILL